MCGSLVLYLLILYYAQMVSRTTLTEGEYCVISDPVVKGVVQFGEKKIVTGPTSFFLYPSEALIGLYGSEWYGMAWYGMRSLKSMA